MAEWLKRAMEEADREFERLPEWKKAAAEDFLSSSRNENQKENITVREQSPKPATLR
jgi:hypothetical protein